jgi:sorting nexin-8
MPERQKLSYVEGYQVLSAECIPDYSALAPEIGSTFGAILNNYSQKSRISDPESTLAAKVLVATPKPKTVHPSGIELCEALLPVMKPACTTPPSNANAELLFDHSLRHFAEDITPYVRAIVAFDFRLQQYRLELSRLLSGNGRGTKRVRTTRASRAALEGGSKSETRKETWFSPTINVPRILATGQKEWQDLLVQNGYFTVPVAGEQRTRESSEPLSESASDIA